jgi:hypothetical protein
MESLALTRNNEIVALRNDEHSIAVALDRFVLPRHLTAEQLGSFLQLFPPQNVAVLVAKDDVEASQYLDDLKQALDRGGWHIKSNEFALDTAPAGLSVNLVQSPAQMKVQPDNRSPNSAIRLQEAFGLAGVRLDGNGGSVRENVKEEILEITVGHRPKDNYILPCMVK